MHTYSTGNLLKGYLDSCAEERVRSYNLLLQSPHRIHTTKKSPHLQVSRNMHRGWGDAGPLPPPRFHLFMSAAQTSDPSAHVE